MKWLALLFGFLRVGCFSFGGAYSAIPLIRDVVLSNDWMTDEELTELIAVSESTPGPIMVNIATYVGGTQGGLPGAAIATAAVVFPAFLIVLLIMTLLAAFIKNRYVQAALDGIRPCVIGIIFATGCFMLLSGFMLQDDGISPDLRSIIIALLLVAVIAGTRKLLNKKITPTLLIVLSAVLGMIAYSI